MDTLRHIEIETPRPRTGYTPIQSFWTVRVTTQQNRFEQWEIVLPLPELLDALKTLNITDTEITVAHPAFEREKTL